MKIQKKKFGGGGGVRGRGGGEGWGGQGGCDRRIEVLRKIKKKKLGWGEGSGWVGVRVDVNEELKFLGKFTKKNWGGGWGVGSEGGGSGWWGVRVDVNEELNFEFKK